jgi:pyrroloquinoline quinone biosynthesis protein B
LIRIRILGAAAGGGLPQWNCSCRNCSDARDGKIPRLTQSCVAISGDDRDWLLINASPDLPAQIESLPALQAARHSPRNSPIRAIGLSNADIDHTLGLILLRQSDQPPLVYAPRAIRDELGWMKMVLERFSGVDWRDPPQRFAQLELGVVNLGRSVAWLFRDRQKGATALIAPAVPEISNELNAAMQRADAILFDGTFWSADELQPFRPNARSAREMGHLPMRETLPALATMPARQRIFTHINNTNPILQPDSPQRKEVEAAGVLVGYDGLEIRL